LVLSRNIAAARFVLERTELLRRQRTALPEAAGKGDCNQRSE
jgi:hypothetical protein